MPPISSSCRRAAKPTPSAGVHAMAWNSAARLPFLIASARPKARMQQSPATQVETNQLARIHDRGQRDGDEADRQHQSRQSARASHDHPALDIGGKQAAHGEADVGGYRTTSSRSASLMPSRLGSSGESAQTITVNAATRTTIQSRNWRRIIGNSAAAVPPKMIALAKRRPAWRSSTIIRPDAMAQKRCRCLVHPIWHQGMTSWSTKW